MIIDSFDNHSEAKINPKPKKINPNVMLALLHFRIL